jgi:6,7-dimethyl-8-ribityllumazine synthase
MSGEGSPQVDVHGTGLRVTIVAGLWHDEISNGLIAGAERALAEMGADFSVVRCAGSFELPLVCQAALKDGADAVVALGVIIRGGTPHFEFVADAATSGLLRVA